MSLRNIALFSSPANKKIISDLKNNRSYNVTEIPQFLTHQRKLSEKETESIINFEKFDWLIFTDIFTVEYFLETLKQSEIDLYLLDEINICVLGEAVADRLRFEQIHADIICSMIDVNEVVIRLSAFIKNEYTDREPKILILKEDSFADELKEKLGAKFKIIKDLSIYYIEEPNDKSISILKAKFTGETFEDFIFTSPEDFVYIQKYFANNKFTENTFQTYYTNSELIYQTLQEFGVNPTYFYGK